MERITITISDCEAGLFDHGQNNNNMPNIGTNGNWFIGTTDTGVKAQGEDGEPGATPEIGENGNWFVANVDTGVKAQGEDGQPGEDFKTLETLAELSKYIGSTTRAIVYVLEKKITLSILRNSTN